jgi:hypothetical protein
MTDKELKAEYERIQAIREWNAKFRYPPVNTSQWREADFDRWFEGRKPLPPFDEWKSSLTR